MAGRGPAPKLNHQRERDTRRRQADSVTVKGDGEVRGPDLSEAGDRAWHPSTVAWYDRWRKSPQAQLFQDTDWGRLLMLAPIVDYYYSGSKPSAAALSEIRLNEERLGATYVDRLRAKIHIEAEEDAEVVTLRPVAAPSLADRMKRPAPAPTPEPEPDF